MIRNSKTYDTQGRNKDGTHVERSENVGSVKIARITGARSGPTWSRITIINYVHHFNATFENSKKKKCIRFFCYLFFSLRAVIGFR